MDIPFFRPAIAAEEIEDMTYWKWRYPSQPGEFAVADRYFSGALTLPLFPGMSDEEVERVARVLREVLA